MAKKRKVRKQQTVVVKRLSVKELRKIIEDARDQVDSLGPYRMEFTEEGYTIQLSRRIKGKVTYDYRTDGVVIILEDGTSWNLDQPGVRNTLKIYVNQTGHVAELESKLGRCEERLNQVWSMQYADDPKIAREIVRLNREVWELQNQLQEKDIQYEAIVAEAARIVAEHEKKREAARAARKKAEDARKKAEDDKKKAEDDKKKAKADKKKVEAELTRTKRRNSRLAAEANDIKTKSKKPYKKPIAGKKGGKRSGRKTHPVSEYRVADQKTCHVCDSPMGNSTATRPRIREDVVNGQWTVFQYKNVRRWCPGCKTQLYAPIPGTLPNQRFGNRALAMMSFLKMIGVSFRKIELIFLVFYNVHISKKTIQEAVRTVSRGMTPQYEAIHNHILEGDTVNGDETSWRVMGLMYWVWCIVGADAVWFDIQKGRGTDEAKKMLPDFQGMVTSDSWPPWNHVGEEHEKCHLHYKRELKKTKKENKNPEFQKFADKLLQILWDSHSTKKGYDPNDDLQTRTRKQRNLLRRLAYLIKKDYTDKDCKRFIKRLRREFYHLFSHVISGIDWHNNKAERAVRCFVLLRHVMFSNRTEFDASTYAKLLSIIGTCAMRGVNPLEYMVQSLSKPQGSPVELPQPPTDPK